MQFTETEPIDIRFEVEKLDPKSSVSTVIVVFEHNDQAMELTIKEVADERLRDEVAADLYSVISSFPRNEVVAFIHDGGLRADFLRDPSLGFGATIANRSELARVGQTRGSELLTSLRASLLERNVSYIATDGSINVNYVGGSFGWITSRGEFGLAAITASDIFACELAAIDMALKSSSVRGRKVVLADSQPALDAIQRVLGGANPDIGGQRKRLASIRDRVRAAEAGVEFVWVRGHQEHPLNDRADRLARHARLYRGDLEEQASQQIIAGIVEGARRDWAAFGGTDTLENSGKVLALQ